MNELERIVCGMILPGESQRTRRKPDRIAILCNTNQHCQTLKLDLGCE
jgi:hypothetical protein